MIRQVMILLSVLSAASPAAALESSLWRDLQIEAQILPARTRINGIEVEAVRFVGRDIGQLERRWRSSLGDTPIRSHAVGNSVVHAALSGSASEILQIPSQGLAKEMIWSRIHLSDTTPAIPRFLVDPPHTCKGGRTVEGEAQEGYFLQRSFLCRQPASAVSRNLADAARRRGFRVRETGSGGFEATLRDARLTVTAVPAVHEPDGRGSALILLERKAAGNVRR